MLPTRFQLDQAQVEAALALGGIRPGPRSMLPPPQPGPHLLRDAQVLGPDGRLTAEAEATLRTAADPVQMLSIMSSRTGGRWAEAVFLRGRNGGPLVAQARQDRKFDLALVPTLTEAVVLIDELLALSDLAARSGDRTLTLNLAGYAALLAAADLLQVTQLESRLARAMTPMPALPPEALQTQLQKGMTNIDTRWAVTAGGMVAPVGLQAASGRMAEGLAALAAAGLADREASGYVFSLPGYLLATSLGELVTTAGLKQMAGSGTEAASVGQVTLFRSVVSIWAFTWDSAGGTEASLSLAELSAGGALFLVRKLLEPVELPAAAPVAGPAAGKRCRCGAEVGADHAFCPKCGARVEEPPPAPPPKPAVCAKCGKPLSEGAIFCPYCGQSVKGPAPAAAPPPPPVAAGPPPNKLPPFERRCPNPSCGRPVPPGKKFCTACGSPVS